MKYIVIVPDGIADHPSEELGGKTPLEIAKLPNLHYFAKSGKVGSVRHLPDRMETATYIAALSLFGYNPKESNTGLGPLEAANLEVKLEENEVAFRMNLATETEGVFADYSAGHISTKESKALVNFLNKQLSSEFVRFFAGTGYRHIAVMRDAKGLEAFSARCLPPIQVVGKKIEDHLPTGTGAELIKKLMSDAKSLLEQHEINQVRIDLGENPANLIWLWGQGAKPNLTKFTERFGMTGAIVSAIDYIKGLGRLIGLTVVEVPGVSGDVDSNFEAKANAMLEVLKERDFVSVHVRACDEASHRGNLRQKISALEAIDYYVLGAVKTFCEEAKEVRVLISPFVLTPWKTRAHSRESVPFIISGKNVVPDEIEKFSEQTARLSRLRFKEGWKLMDYFISGKE